jgi:diguanylate cyclase
MTAQHPHALVKKLRSFFAAEEVAGTSHDDQHHSHFIDQIDKVRDFFIEYGIEPTPDHYALIYRHRILGEHGLGSDIDELIATRSWSPGTNGISLSEIELADLINRTLEQLNGVEALVGRSRRDVEGYGTALSDGAESLQADSGPANAILGLIALTREMVSKVKAAEEELHHREAAITTMQQALTEAKSRADTDLLTGLSNRRAFERELGASFERCRRHDLPLSLAICDVDHFKSINDRFGHVTGDRVLRLIADIISDHCDGKGLVSRFGGEEFVIIFENIAIEDAQDIIDTARVQLRARKIVKKETGEPLGTVSLSAGIAAIAQVEDPGALLRAADLALYAAKANGRDKVCCAASPQAEN